jgi:hypothetical protein
MIYNNRRQERRFQNRRLCQSYFFPRIFRLWLSFSLVVLIPSLYGGGMMDPDLLVADKLIENREYDEALLLLTEYSEKNPERFYQAQKRMRKIFQLREEYNTLAGELLDMLNNDPDNSAKILALTHRLEGMEPSRGQVQVFLDRTKELAQFGYNRNRLEQILVDGRALLDKGQYVAAINCYAGGLDIYQDEFFSADYGDLINNQVHNSLRTLAESITLFTSLAVSLNNALAGMELVRSGEGDRVSQLRVIYNRLYPELEQMISINNAIAETGNFYDKQLAILHESDNAMGDRSFLSFASRLIYGREEEDLQEGILGSVAGLWHSVLSSFDNTLLTLTDQSFRDAYIATAGQEFAQARVEIEALNAYCSLAIDYIDLWRRFYEAQNPAVQWVFGVEVLSVKAEDYLNYFALSLAAEVMRELGPLQEQYNRIVSMNSGVLESWQRGALGGQQAVAQESATRHSFRELAVRVQPILARFNRNRNELLERMHSFNSNRRNFSSIENVLSLLSRLDTGILNQEITVAIREYTISNGEFERGIADWQREFSEANRLLEGIQIQIEGSSVTAKYPTEALVILDRISQSASSGLAVGSILIAQYVDETPWIIGNHRIGELFSAARGMMNQLDTLHFRVTAMAGTAQTQIAQAEALRLDGDRLYLEAQNAMVQGNFDTARDRVLRSGERYDASLAIEESVVLRKTRDTQLVNLGAEITRMENEAVVRAVRTLVNTARDTYFAGNFEQAEEYLVRAMNRWKRTNVDEDAELIYWLTVVRGALTLRAGRTIPITAPLYAEMSQLLSEAKRNYDDGIRLINGNRRQEGIVKFINARQKTKEVRIMFPVNQEARLLELRMDQVTDPRAFNESFSRRLADAVTGTKRGSVEAFADLQNLAEINPHYPGIRGMVTQAEIDLGYRPVPPNAQSLSRANELAASARSIIERNVRAQFPVALEQLNQALLLNPSNNLAMSLKDRVQTELGGGGSVVLSSAAEREYQRAVQELQQGNTLVAMTIVRQLLQDTKNRNSTRILELQRRIESIL